MTPKNDDRLKNLRLRIAQTTPEPGIYRWLDANGRILYVGKAKNLKKRLSSYVSPGKKADGPWKQSFREQITDFDVTVVTSELEALLLETNLIKQLRPKYNVLMKDDKSYLFVRISAEEYPRVETIRRFPQDGAKYFGPYLNSYEVYETLDLLHEAIGYRACKYSLDTLNKKPDAMAQLKECLEHQIGKCNGLCAGKITKEEYKQRIAQVVDFFKGRKESVKGILLERMKTAAKDRKFELAKKLRDYLSILEGKTEKQVATDTTGENCDILGVAVLSNRAHVVIMHRRDGRLIGEVHFSLAGQAESVASVLEQFLPQYYDDGREIPESILLPDKPEDAKVIQQLLKERRGGSVKLVIPERGRKSRLLQLAERNAREKGKQLEAKWESEDRNTAAALEQLQEILQLPTVPKRIEGYDISHLGGTETVGSMVVMKDGKSANDHYRSFTIRTLKAGDVDDYQAIREVLARRIRRLTEDIKEEEKKWNENDITFGKALKKDQGTLGEIDYKTTFVARHEGEIVGRGALIKHPQGIVELKSLWVSAPYESGPLCQFIARKMLRSVKKGKVYIACNPDLEQQYAHIGFRYVMTPPKVFEGCELVMMWEAHQNKVDPSLTARPDLIVVDGGKGQLSTAVDVLKIYHCDIPVIGLAKREEEIFLPEQSDSISPVPRSAARVVGFPNDSPAKFLLMRLRDEAHRFSNRHRETRLKHAATSSALFEIPGIGEETAKKLLAAFGSLSGIREATDEQLLSILTSAQLAEVKRSLV